MSNELAVIGADISNQQAGNPSFFDRAQMFTSTAVVSGIASIYNTFADYTNMAGGSMDMIDVNRVLQSYDDNWYKYYKENQQLVDVAGFVGGSFLPGGLAVKGLRALQTAKNLGATGRAIQGPLNFALRKRDAALEAGMKEIAAEGGTAFSYINANKLAAMGWGVADNLLVNAAFEVGAVMALKNSPVLADASTKDVLGDMMVGAMVGGVFGGALDAIVVNRMFKDTVKQLGTKQREFDVLVNYTRMGLSGGDEMYGFVDSLLQLPKEVLDSKFVVQNKFSAIAPTSNKLIELDAASHLAKVLKGVEKQAYDEVMMAANRLGTASTPEIGQNIGNMILGLVKEGVENGKSAADIKTEVGNLVLGMKKARGIADDAPLVPGSVDEMFYLADEIDVGRLGANVTVDALIGAARSRQPFAKNATAKPYQVVGNPADAKMTMTATSFKEAWEAGYDVALVNNRLRINPKSAIFKQVTDPVLLPSRFLNTRTRAVSDEVVATWADMLPAGTDASKALLKEGVLYGKEVINVADNIFPETAFEATARHAWASSLDIKHFAGSVVDANDISRLERLVELAPDQQQKELIKISFGEAGEKTLDQVDLAQTLLTAKLNRTQELLDSGVTDQRVISYITNTTDDWYMRALENGYQALPDLKNNMSVPLEAALKRENLLVTWDSPRVFTNMRDHTGAPTLTEDLLKATEAAASSKGAKYGDSFVTGDLGFWQRVKLRQEVQTNATAAVLGAEDAGKLLDLALNNVAKMANELGAGASTLGAANSNYGDLAQLWAQYTGKIVHNLIQKYTEIAQLRIQPFIGKFMDDRKAAAELGIISTMLRRTPDKMYLVTTAEGKTALAVREVVSRDEMGQKFVNSDALSKWVQANPGKSGVFEIESQLVADFLGEWQQLNAIRVDKRKTLMNARGATVGWDPEAIYAPPIDTSKYKYFAFVKIRNGHIASNSDVGMITAKDQADLNKLVNQLPEEYEAFFKADTEQYYKVKAEYDDQLALNEPRVNSDLAKKGKLSDFFYETRAENVLEDFIRYNQNAESSLVRQAVDVRYTQLITELRALGEQYTKAGTSKFSGLSRFEDRSVVNPFEDYIKTALDISKRSQYPILASLNEWVDSAGTTAYRIWSEATNKARAGEISWQEAEKIASRYGVGGAYNADNAIEAWALANKPMDRNIIREGVAKINSFLATVGLRLDFANSIVNTISMPIMLGSELASIKSLAKTDPEALGALQKVFNTGGDLQVPSYTKVIANAIKNVTGPERQKYLQLYKESGDIKDVVSQFHSMLDEVAINPRITPSAWGKWVDDKIELGAKITGNNYAEDFTRAVSANVMDQLTEPLVTRGLLSTQEAAAYRSVFVNRVNGNYIASQRPIAFQGTVGAAISLFQTYMFNVMQQLTRHIENRDARAAFTMIGMQGALYGLNGLPFFEAVNTHIIGNANINDGHRDIYTTTTQLAGKEMGDWLLYGTASALPIFGDKSPAFYTRGDINPRHISVLPVSPLDIPAVDVTLRFAKNIKDFGSKIASGVDLSTAFLEGLEHNGISRPLAGIAQLKQEYVSTSKGSLISASNEFNATVWASRLLGAKPMDESVALNTMFRMQAYKAADLDRLSKLGEVVKTKLRAGAEPTAEDMQDFMLAYARAGGNLQNYTAALQRWSRDANMSVVNQMKMFHQSSYAQRLSEIMGDTTLDDYMTARQRVMDQ